MSAKWRRRRIDPYRYDIFRANTTKHKTSNTPLFKTSRTKRQSPLYKYRMTRSCEGRKLKEPEPLIDVLEEENEITVVTELVGFNKENVQIHVKNQRLTMSAETRDRKYHKSLNLPKRVIPETMNTSYKNGVLQIVMKKALEEKALNKIAG